MTSAMNTQSDIIRSRMLSSGCHYYSDGKHLREKHRLAGDGFLTWSLERISSWSKARILDAGGGWGRFVWNLLSDYGVSSKDIVLGDISEGMLKSAAAEARQRSVEIALVANSIEALPFPMNYFDIVMANKVLYHLADVSSGIGELARVLKPSGVLLATTNSESITATVVALHNEALARLGMSHKPEPASAFSMENGYNVLALHFRRVEIQFYEDEMLFDSAAAMRRLYETTGRYRNLLYQRGTTNAAAVDLPNMVERLAQEIIDRDGVLPSPIRMGAFVCEEPL